MQQEHDPFFDDKEIIYSISFDIAERIGKAALVSLFALQCTVIGYLLLTTVFRV